MISRIVRPELAVSFTPATPDFSAEDFDVVEYATGISGSTPYASIGDQVISTNLYLSCYSNVFSDILQQCAAQNMGFSWDLYYGDTPIDEYMDGTAMAAAAYTLWHNAHKNDTYDTSSVLSAKHILISNQSRTDAEALALAKDLYSQLAASTFSPALFDELMNTYSEDGRNADGTLGAPDGYTFGPGEMVPEFEAGTKALALGAVSQPIKTDYGYHIILRTAPDLEDYISSLAYNAYKTWYRTASFVPGDGYNSLDLIEIATLMSLIVN